MIKAQYHQWLWTNTIKKKIDRVDDFIKRFLTNNKLLTKKSQLKSNTKTGEDESEEDPGNEIPDLHEKYNSDSDSKDEEVLKNHEHCKKHSTQRQTEGQQRCRELSPIECFTLQTKIIPQALVILPSLPVIQQPPAPIANFR